MARGEVFWFDKEINKQAARICQLEKQNAAMRKTLDKIAKGEGPFSLDHLTHANNTISYMMSIAKQAIAQVGE